VIAYVKTKWNSASCYKPHSELSWDYDLDIEHIQRIPALYNAPVDEQKVTASSSPGHQFSSPTQILSSQGTQA
jgi:hypothetical protein